MWVLQNWFQNLCNAIAVYWVAMTLKIKIQYKLLRMWLYSLCVKRESYMGTGLSSRYMHFLCVWLWSKSTKTVIQRIDMSCRESVKPWRARCMRSRVWQLSRVNPMGGGTISFASGYERHWRVLIHWIFFFTFSTAIVGAGRMRTLAIDTTRIIAVLMRITALRPN